MDNEEPTTYGERLAWRALKGDDRAIINYRAVDFVDSGGAIKHYVELGLEPGSFFRCMIIGDHHGAYRSMHPILKDELNTIQRLTRWFFENAPELCYGSQEKYNYWVLNGGIFGIEENGKKVHLKVDEFV